MRNLIKKILKESDDFDWARGDAQITLGDAFESGLINKGDKFWVWGYTSGFQKSESVYLDGWFIITDIVDKDSIVGNPFITSPEIIELFGLGSVTEGGIFVESDADLNVYKIERSSQ